MMSSGNVRARQIYYILATKASSESGKIVHKYDLEDPKSKILIIS